MAQNDNVTPLDTVQALKRAVEADHDAIRIVQVHDQDISIELDASDGDSVLALPKNSILTGEADAKELRAVSVYYKGAGNVKLQCSPTDSGDVWATVSTLAAGVDLACSRVEVVARRVRLVIDVGAQAYLVGQS